jgi:RNA polymerase sigma factor (sigma-70 family)
MPGRPLEPLIGRLRQALRPLAGGLGDAQLLERWLAQRDEAAFEVLVWRYGPMVLGVCRRLLRHPQDVEDAFQATFLTFVRKAGSIRKREGVSSWLYKVAYRIAIRAGQAARRRQQRQQPLIDVPATVQDLSWSDLQPVLDEEVNRLPLRYRTTFLLCYFQGRTNAEAARELGCPEGTIASRLAGARKLLRQRLLRRGISAGAAGLALTSVPETVAAELPVALAHSTVRAGLGFAMGNPLAGLVSSRTVSLTEGVLRTMFLQEMKMVALVVLVVGLLGGGGLTYGLMAHDPPPAQVVRPADTESPKPTQAPATANVVSEQEGILLFLGTPPKDGEKAPEDRSATITVGNRAVKYRRLQVGDMVEEGQVLGQLDDQLARVDVEIKQAKVHAAESTVITKEKVIDQAQQYYRSQQRLFNDGARGATSAEDVRYAQLTWLRHVSELSTTKQDVVVAQLELKRSQTILASYQIRSRVRGVIKAIRVHPGEAARRLDPVFLIELTKE